MSTTRVMSCGRVYQIEATGLLPKHSDRQQARARLSPLPVFAQRAQFASSAVVVSYTLLGKKDHGVRGAGQLRPSSIFRILSKPASSEISPFVVHQGVSAETFIVKPQLERLDCGGLVNKATNDSSVSPPHHAADDMGKKKPLTVPYQKHSTEGGCISAHKIERESRSRNSSYTMISSQFPIRRHAVLTSLNVFSVALSVKVQNIQARYCKCWFVYSEDIY